jgi:hypothetical protein
LGTPGNNVFLANFMALTRPFLTFPLFTAPIDLDCTHQSFCFSLMFQPV